MLALLRAVEFCGVNIEDKNLCAKHNEEVTEYNLKKIEVTEYIRMCVPCHQAVISKRKQP